MANTPRICLGFGDTEGKCTNLAGTKWSPHWCEACNKVRMEAVTRQMEEILRRFEEKAAKMEVQNG